MYRKKSKINERDEKILLQIKQVMSENPSYGHRRIALALKLNKKRILRVMKKHNLKPYRRRTNKPRKLHDENKPDTKISNLIKNFCPIAPNIVWVSDFTYISYQNRFIYLATVMDVFTRQIVGWNILSNHTKDLVIEAFKHAIKQAKSIPQILHSDQGSEYDSKEYFELLVKYEIKISMSRKAAPWENGFQESFYAGFKLDLGDPNRLNNLGELIEAIYQQLYTYNNFRIHTKLKMSPCEFHLNYLNKFESVITQESLSQIWGT